MRMRVDVLTLTCLLDLIILSGCVEIAATREPAITMSLRKGLYSVDYDDDDSELSLEEVGPKSIAILQRDLSLEEVGPKSMAILAGRSTVEPTRQEVNGKEGIPVPQPRPRKKPQEDKQVAELLAENTKLKGHKADLAQQLEREKRESETRARQQDELIATLRTQLEVWPVPQS